MRRLYWLVASCAITAAPASVCAQQQATPEQINKALELLRSDRAPLVGVSTNAPKTTSSPPATITDPRALRQASQQAEAARQQALREAQRLPSAQPTAPATLAQEQELRARQQAAPAKAAQDSDAKAQNWLQSQAARPAQPPATPVAQAQPNANLPSVAVQAPGQPAANMMTPEMEKQAREALWRVMTNTQNVQVPPLAMPGQPAKADVATPKITVAPSSMPRQTEPVAVPKAPALKAMAPQQEQQALQALRQAPAAGPELNPDQEKRALEALRNSYSQPVQTAQPKPAPQPQPTAPVVAAPKAPEIKPAVPVAVTPATPALTPDAEKKALEALRKSYEQPASAAQSKPAVPTLAAPKAPETKPIAPVVAAPKAAEVKPAPPIAAAPAPTLSPDAEKKALEALRKSYEQPGQVAQPKPATPAQPAQAAELTDEARRAAQKAELEEAKRRTLKMAKEAEKAEAINKRAAKEKAAASKKAEEESKRLARVKAEADAKAKKDLERINAESQAKAEVEARKRTGGETRAQAPAPAAAQPSTAKPATAASALAEKPVKAKDAEQAAPVKTSVKKGDKEPVQTGPKTKAQRLADLLQSYMNDKLTPTEYHQQRAKILAEP